MAAEKSSQGVWILAAVVALLGVRALPGGSTAPAAVAPVASAVRPTPTPTDPKNDCAEKNCDVECSAGLDATLEGFKQLYKTTPRALIALVADPVDSGLAYYFDATLEGAEAAAGDVVTGGGWVRDRFFLPWKALDNEGKPRTDLFACRKSVPGVVLYRRSQGTSTEGLALFLVGETSTWGITQPVFADAMRRVTALRPTAEAQRPIEILGPTFSGTANSLASALEIELDAAQKAGAALSFKVRSGTATATSTALTLDALNGQSTKAKRVDYKSAAPEDDNLRCAMFHKLHESLRVATHSRGDQEVLEGVALLSEGATVYGTGFRSAAVRAQCPTPEFVYGFPNLSDIRTAYGDAPPAPNELGLPQSRVDLATAHDPPARIHPMLSSWTPVARDIGLATALSNLAVRSVRYVGLVATDVSDLTFLAQRVKRQLPDVRLFTFENDVVFEHPEYAVTLNGMLVVHPTRVDKEGTPLAPSTLTNVSAREMVQGVYLAALDLLDDRPIAAAIPEVSVVGNGKLWSIGPPLGKHPAAPVVPRVFWLLAAWLGFFASLNGGAYLIQGYWQRAREHWSLLPLRALRRCVHADLAAAHSVRVFVLLLVVLTPALLVLGISWSVPGFSAHRLLLLGGVAINALALLAACIDMLRAFVIRRLVPPTAWGYLIMALLVGAFTLLGVSPWAASAPPQRSVTLASGVSPILPVLLGAALVYILVLCGLIRIRLLDTQLPKASEDAQAAAGGAPVASKSGVPFHRLPLGIARALGLTHREPAAPAADLQCLERRLVQSLHDPWSIAQSSVLLTSASLVAGFALLFDAKPMLTLEEWHWHVLLLATFMACLLVQGLTYVQLWLYFAQLRMLLHRLAHHPIASALRRVPSALLRPVQEQLLATRPEMLDLTHIVQLLGELAVQRPELEKSDEALLPQLPTRAELRAAHDGAQSTLVLELERVANRLVPQRGALCDTLLGVAHCLSLSLEPIWQRSALPGSAPHDAKEHPDEVSSLDVYASSLSAPALAFAQRAEAFVASLIALQMLRYVRYFRYFVVALLAGAVLFVLMIALYAVQPQRLMLNVELGVTTVTVGTVLWMFFALDRDSVLSALAGTNAGEVTLNGNLVTRVFTWGVLPMLSAIAAQYPEFSQWAFAAVEPLTNALR